LLFAFNSANSTCDELACGESVATCVMTCTCAVPECACCYDCLTCLKNMWTECCSCFNVCGLLPTTTTNTTSIIITDQGMVKKTTNFIPIKESCNGSSSYVECYRCSNDYNKIQTNYCSCHNSSCIRMDKNYTCCDEGYTANCFCDENTGVAKCSCIEI